MKTVLELSPDRARFRINGRETFLLFASYYGGLALDPSAAGSDLRALAARGFNGVRVWCTWAAFGHDISAVDARGRLRAPFAARLKALCDICDGLGMALDVTFSHGVPPDPAVAEKPWLTSPLEDADAHRAAVRAIAGQLRTWRNWYVDVANERNVPPRHPVAFELAGELIRIAHEAAPGRPATVSSAGCIPDAEIAGYAVTAGVDFLAPHRVRAADSPRATEAETRRYRERLAALGRPRPVHYQEPFRRDFTVWQPGVEDFLADLAGAIRGGAAGWCFHNGYNRFASDGGGRPRRCFDLRDGALMDQLDPVEREVLDRAAEVAAREAAALQG